jgi:hypothetical protein
MGWQELGIVITLQQFQPTLLEGRLLRAEVVSDSPVRNQTANAGTNNTTAVILADSSGPLAAFHKPLDGIDAAQAARYGHDRHSAIVNESAAWLVAKALGPPYRDMVPDVVVRSIWPKSPGAVGGYGALTVEAPGEAKQAAPQQNPAECDPAAFFDALIGQQDRHEANYRWQPGQLGLLDNAYSFAAPGYLQWASDFVQVRHKEGRTALDPNELALLRRLRQPSAWWTWLGMMLRVDQYKAFENRIDKMLQTGQLLQPLEF